MRRVRGKVSQLQSLVRGVIARGEAHCALEETEALQDPSKSLRNRGVSEAEIVWISCMEDLSVLPKMKN